jgi:NACalpha-BTF3-like transcription factor
MGNKPMGPGFNSQDCPGMGGMHNKMKHGGEKKFDRDGMGNENFGPMMMEQLGLTLEQKEKIHQLKIKYEKNEIANNAELKTLRLDKREAMRNMNFENAKKVVKQMADVKTKIQISKIDEMNEITKVLDKGQLEKFREMHSNPGMMKHKMKMNK